MNQSFLHREPTASVVALIARVLLAYIFIVAGWAKIGGYAGVVGYMESKGLPSALLPLVIALEFGGGIALLIGLKTQLIALLLAVFCIVSGFIFHGAPEEASHLRKNLAMAGGYLALALAGAGRFSVDAMLAKKS